MNFLILLAVLGAVAYRVVSPEDRARYFSIAGAYARQLKSAATAPRPDYESFLAALRARAPRLVVVPALLALNLAVFVMMIRGSGSLSDPSTLVGWGANLGTRTTNGEWWRLLTAMFVHIGVIQLAVNAMVLLQLGAIVERLVGRAALAAASISGGVFAGLHHVAAEPVDVGTSASAAIWPVYGVMAGCILWQLARRTPERAPLDEGAPSPIVVPAIAMKRIAVVGVLFLLVSAVDGLATASELTSLFVGLAFGAVVGWRAANRAPTPRAVGVMCAAAAVAAVIYAVPLRNIADVKPAVDAVVAAEAKTTGTYNQALDRFTHQRISADALADLADRAIVPELEAADARMQALQHVPAEHQPLVGAVREFLRLRCASWHARAEALRRTHKNLRAADVGGSTAGRVQAEGRFRSTMTATGKAEAAERVASEAFARVKQNYSWRPMAE